ncbi:IS701 family transposase [Paraliomyxa miuraensis]|uniref:IS701 family transposase n=1 Tax=Paraliomyxa miuraensis TaxID=376150 RepID=UPI00225237BF|nr:transposase [Paraliomyxa miuraensis]MCX4244394.1 transposase [Paraliomyxa miuraensis]
MLPQSFAESLLIFESCFTAPSFRRFLTIVMGWIRCTGKHTITGVMRAAGVVGIREHSGYHRFFSRGAWEPDSVGLALMKLVLGLLSKTARVTLAVDDTLGRHTGKHISSAGMHHDPLLSCAGRSFWHFGHKWVVLAVVVEFPRWDKSFSLPVLVRLYRTEKVNKQLGKSHRKITELATELLELVSEKFPKRQFLVVADASYINCSVVRPLPHNIQLLGRGRMDAALYAPAPTYRGRGRPRVKGKRLPSPKDRRGKWTSLDLLVYGRPATIEIKVFKAVWYKVSHGRELLFVVVRGWPGHVKQDVLVSTDLEKSAQQVVELYCLRWSLEETFGWVKSRVGFEDPQTGPRQR